MNQARFELMLIGWVESPLTDPKTAPKQGFEGAPEAMAGVRAKGVTGTRGNPGWR